MEIGNTDNPGTTIQCFGAVVVLAKFLFSHSEPELYRDVILNPEGYLFACGVALIVLLVLVNYLVGAYIFRHTSNMGTAILFQLAPLINVNIIQRGIVLGPEAAIIISAGFFMAYLYVNSGKQSTMRVIITCAVFSAFMIASKYTSFPVVILVLFILQGSKYRLVYLAATVAAFFVFIIPAIPKLNGMFQWVWSIAAHDGIYGKGEARIVNPVQFFNNLQGIILTDAVFSSIYGLITFAFFFSLTAYIRKKKAPPFSRTITGVWVSVTVLILVVAKHAEFHYLIFAECCFPLGLVVSYKILSPYARSIIKNYGAIEKIATYSFLSVLCIFLVIEKIRYIPLRQPKWVGVNGYISKYKNIPLIVSIKDGMACETEEPALFLGYMYSGNMQAEYSSFLNKLYPNTWIYWSNVHRLLNWNKEAAPNELLDKTGQVLIYTKGYDEAARINVIHSLEGDTLTSTKKFTEQEVFSNEATLQRVSLITKIKS